MRTSRPILAAMPSRDSNHGLNSKTVSARKMEGHDLAYPIIGICVMLSGAVGATLLTLFTVVTLHVTGNMRGERAAAVLETPKQKSQVVIDGSSGPGDQGASMRPDHSWSDNFHSREPVGLGPTGNDGSFAPIGRNSTQTQRRSERCSSCDGRGVNLSGITCQSCNGSGWAPR